MYFSVVLKMRLEAAQRRVALTPPCKAKEVPAAARRCDDSGVQFASPVDNHHIDDDEDEDDDGGGADDGDTDDDITRLARRTVKRSIAA